jgi:hypothetical protein
MANPPCMSGDGNPAVMVATMLNNGDGFALCDECLVGWAAGLLQVMTGVDPAPFIAAVSDDEVTDDQVAAAEHAVDQGAPEAATLPTGRKARSGRTSNGSQKAGMDADLDGDTTPSDDADTPLVAWWSRELAGGDDGPTGNPLLRMLFGNLQTAAVQGLDTASIWQSLRTSAGEYQFRLAGAEQPYDPAAVEEAGRQILSANGVNASTVSSFRGVAGEWNAARGRLAELEPDQQITSNAIFRPPWAVTDDPNVPDRYRIRTQWQFEASNGATFSQWQSNEIDGPLLGTADALTQAPAPANTYPPQLVLGDAPPPSLLGFEIEQI